VSQGRLQAAGKLIALARRNPEQSISCGGSGCASLEAFDEPTAFEAICGPHEGDQVASFL
jgi:hypothetical protein